MSLPSRTSALAAVVLTAAALPAQQFPTKPPAPLPVTAAQKITKPMSMCGAVVLPDSLMLVLLLFHSSCKISSSSPRAAPTVPAPEQCQRSRRGAEHGYPVLVRCPAREGCANIVDRGRIRARNDQ